MLVDEIIVRLTFFFGLMTIIIILESLYSKRPLLIKRKVRWRINFSLIVINNIIKFFIPFTAVSLALYAEKNQIGLFNFLTPIPLFIKIISSVILLDLIIYLQHVFSHALPWFWRLHKIHHIDQEFDATTGLRFHPLEVIISTFIKCATVLIFGIPFIAVLIFETVLNALAIFNHSNIALPFSIDKFLRLVIVTPDMHRVHHSVIKEETNSNYGFGLSLWDKIFKSYKDQPKKGHLKMTIGLNNYREINKTNLLDLLIIPFYKVHKG